MEILKKAIVIYGNDSQINVAIEEMSELTKELCKAKRNLGCKLNIAEEIADVEIMLEQLKIIYNCDTLVETYRTKKLMRLSDRLDQCVNIQVE